MFMNRDATQFSGSLFAVGASYAFLSLCVTGPLIGARMVEKLGWAAKCERLITDEIAAAQPHSRATPKFGCNDIFGTLFGEEGAELCAYYGDVLDNNPLTQTAEAIEEAQRGAQNLRREMAISRASTRCECAVTKTLEERRVPLAIFGGSARAVTPPSIKHLESDLTVNLNSSDCSMKG